MLKRAISVFFHDEDDLPTFRMIISQPDINGNTTQPELCRPFGISVIGVKRAVKKYRKQGAAGSYEPRNTRGPTILTAEPLSSSQTITEMSESTGYFIVIEHYQ